MHELESGNSRINDIHCRILGLLNLDLNDLSFKDFKSYISLLEDILATKRIDFTILSPNESFLLIYYFIACQLLKRGQLTNFTFNRIKAEKLGELSIEYSDPARNKDIDSKDFCNNFTELVKDLAKRVGTGHRRVIGVIS
ncbi:DUF3890 domain-containing protein [Borrelia sp. A-FGy1]|uniref:DUF3890 domain-containing protein n=1 Tax=Borrelia sp. A-FGy1 TaxID=2608247 RepID=UPI0015F36561|nr:DUF3890 domain-containing protein [Borrelia sp. A-FGy1]